MILKLAKWIIKVIISGIIAFVILNLFCIVYYNVPVHFDNPTGATDYVFENNMFYSRATEGFALGYTNDEGFKNSFDYADIDSVNMLIMGSSHMEAYQISQKYNVSDRLIEYFDNKKTIYNIGTSGHNLLYCVSNLKQALTVYKPTDYVIIETNVVSFTNEQLNKVCSGNLEHLESNNKGIIGALQKSPYLRLLYSQLENIKNVEPVIDNMITESDTINNYNCLESFLELVSCECSNHNIKPIIFFHPCIVVNSEGIPCTDINSDDLQKFKEICEQKNIIFVDMTDTFIQNYNEKYILPHGFYNTSAGKGHLNKYGHEMIAQKLYEVIINNKEK